MFKLLIILPWLTLMFQPLNAKVEAPNYNFSLDALSVFTPNSPLSTITEKYGKPELMNTINGAQTQKFYVSHIRYKFPVLVQIRDEKVMDSFARLPSYFLHDIFLQSLVNKMGKQNLYKKNGEEAFYVWEKDGNRHVYSASCTITCFPIFYAVEPLSSTSSIMNQMKRSWK